MSNIIENMDLNPELVQNVDPDLQPTKKRIMGSLSYTASFMGGCVSIGTFSMGAGLIGVLTVGQAILAYIAGPGTPYGSKACAVSDVEHAAKFMFQLVGSPVPAIGTASSKAIMREAGSPHDFCTGVIILRILFQNQRILHDSAKQCLADSVRHLHIRALVEVSFHRMHQNIHASALRLVIWKRICKFRIQDGKPAAAIFAFISTLL